jgi:hypothetical protein
VTAARMVTGQARFQRLTVAPKRSQQSDASEAYVPGLYGPVGSTDDEKSAVSSLLRRRGAADLAAMLGVEAVPA